MFIYFSHSGWIRDLLFSKKQSYCGSSWHTADCLILFKKVRMFSLWKHSYKPWTSEATMSAKATASANFWVEFNRVWSKKISSGIHNFLKYANSTSSSGSAIHPSENVITVMILSFASLAKESWVAFHCSENTENVKYLLHRFTFYTYSISPNAMLYWIVCFSKVTCLVKCWPCLDSGSLGFSLL